MLRELTEWILRTMQLVEGQRKQQAKISELEKRVRDLEQAVDIISREARHAREIEAVLRENLLLRLENAVKPAPEALPDAKVGDRKNLE